MNQSKTKILLVGPFLPGKNFGGPLKSILNLIQTLKDQFDFKVLTTDRDQSSIEPYSNVKINEWYRINDTDVFYIPKKKSILILLVLLRKEKYDVLYCSSFFSKFSVCSQFFKRLGLIKPPVIVAPRGEFEDAALAIKTQKKKIYLTLYKLLGLKNKVVFTCTSEHDRENITKILGKNIQIVIANNIPDQKNLQFSEKLKTKGKLKIATVSRISRIKNIDYSLNLLKSISKSIPHDYEIIFDIFGPIEDSNYYSECKNISDSIGDNIEVSFCGSLDYDKVVCTLSDYHLFLFPSKSENYGHVIHEALIASCPIIISNTTPWKGLEEKNVGSDIGLENIEKFTDKLIEYLNMNETEYKILSKNAFNYGMEIRSDRKAINENIELFNFALEQHNR